MVQLTNKLCRKILIAGLFCTTYISVGTVHAARKTVQIASPLQSLTRWDPELKEMKRTRRELFLLKFRAGLQAEVEERKKLLTQRDVQKASTTSYDGDDWAQKVALADKSKHRSNEQIVERAYDKAVEQAEKAFLLEQQQKLSSLKQKKQEQKYQFVGIINPAVETWPFSKLKKANGAVPPITWYARKKPTSFFSKNPQHHWTVRLVHVNRDIIVKDLYDQNRIDVYASYTNTGTINPETKQPIVSCRYIIKKKSWR